MGFEDQIQALLLLWQTPHPLTLFLASQVKPFSLLPQVYPETFLSPQLVLDQAFNVLVFH